VTGEKLMDESVIYLNTVPFSLSTASGLVFGLFLLLPDLHLNGP
jgi:hypothetical protein